VTTISAISLASSVHHADERLRGDTFELRYPRAIHSELMTHRVFSRNASSSRAIPVKKLISDVMTDPFIPIHWGKNQKGMQAYETQDALIHLGEDEYNKRMDVFGVFLNEQAWLHARDRVVKVAEGFAKAGYHKQIINRMLEPWAHINVVLTGTQFANFFALRDHPAAEPHIRKLAGEMKHVYINRTRNMTELRPGHWHLPYVYPDDGDDLREYSTNNNIDIHKAAIIKSVACCASVSYKTVDGEIMNMDRAKRIYDSLLADTPIHASPAEHQFTADSRTILGKWFNPELGGNLGPGWIQYRKTLPQENILTIS
jgi:hypothetical protein